MLGKDKDGRDGKEGRADDRDRDRDRDGYGRERDRDDRGQRDYRDQDRDYRDRDRDRDRDRSDYSSDRRDDYNYDRRDGYDRRDRDEPVLPPADHLTAGHVSCAQLREALGTAGLHFSAEEVQLLAAGFGSDGRGGIRATEFCDTLQVR